MPQTHPAAPEFGLDFRPLDYWGQPGFGLANVKGQVRRRVLRQELAAGRGAQIPPEVANDALSEGLREAQGRMHPAMMGGEYLPASRRHEVEIARVWLSSTLCDVTSIRARPLARGIGYRIVDEYPENGKFDVRPRTSRRPLALGQLIHLIDHSYSPTWGCDGLVLGAMEQQYSCSGELDALRDFFHVESEFYPQLAQHYEREMARWLVEHGDTTDDDDWDEEEDVPDGP